MSGWFDDLGFAVVARGLTVGAYPVDEDDVGELARAGITCVVNMCEDAEYGRQRARAERALAAAGIAELRFPCRDYGGLAEDYLSRVVGAVCAQLTSGQEVYLHCRAGWQRSAAVAAGVIALRERLDLDEALRVLRARKPTAEPLRHQREDLARWWAARDRATRAGPSGA